MKKIFDITQEHIANRHELLAGNPIDFVLKRAQEITNEADAAKKDPSCLALCSHFAIELEQQLMMLGVRANENVIRGAATASMAAAIREWEKINLEYQTQFYGPRDTKDIR